MRNPVLLLAVSIAACGSSNGKINDAPVATPDAAVVTADGRPNDAPIQIDAPTGDAARIDARPPPDSGPPEDAPPIIDARPGVTPDASGGPCLPKCYTDILTSLAADCIAAGTCTSNIALPTITICYDNGVKIVTTIGESSVTITHKKGTTVCYSEETTGTPTTLTTLLKNGAGTTVAKIFVPNINEPEIQQYTCGSDAPITVDLTRPECQGMVGDAGIADAGPTCTLSATCQP